MTSEEIKRLFANLNIWRRGDERAPHKPLLILYALGKLSRGEGPEIPYRQVDDDLRRLLIEFGPDRTSYHPEYPFWRLQNDDIWVLRDADNLEARNGNTDAKKSELLKYNVAGEFIGPVYEALRANASLLREIATDLLDSHFPSAVHDDILAAVGLDLDYSTTRRRPRDPAFRRRVLIAYEHRCAICDFSVRLDDSVIGIEAAHIKWHQAGGPDREDNGLALCVLHHKTFDRGVFTVSTNRVIQVSERAYGTHGFEEWLMRFHGADVREPINPGYFPRNEFLEWHGREVFRGPARE